MALEAPYPEISELLLMIGQAGLRLSEIEATEGAAGNISVYMGWPVEPRRIFPLVETVEMPEVFPELDGKSFLVTGSGRRLREIIHEPEAHLGFIIIQDQGRTARLHCSPKRRFARLTSELNSHLGIHRDQIAETGTNFHVVIHAQPPHLTYLSHIPEYRDDVYLNQHILRWEPETIVQLPEGVGHVPFHVPGSLEQGEATRAALRKYHLIIWGKHGVVVRSNTTIKHASDLIEYAETGARYEYMNLRTGERGEGLTAEEIRAICKAFKIEQSIF